MAPRRQKKPEGPSLPNVSNAHRYLLPFPEVGGAALMAMNCIAAGTVEVYRNRKTGGLMLGHVCPDCDTHHPLIELYCVEDDYLNSNDRYVLPVRGCLPYQDYLDECGGVIAPVEEPHRPSRDLIARLAADHDDEPETTLEEIFSLIPDLAGGILEGDASFALDMKTGRTVVGLECDECDEVHALVAIDMPRHSDMRSAAGYEFLGNPFLDLLLKATGEARH